MVGAWSKRAAMPDANDPERARCRALRCLLGEIAPIVLLPGDPSRAERISKDYLTGSRLVMLNREFHSYTGAYCGTPISVVSTGLGSPGAAMVMEDLARLGVKAAIRVGTAGSAQTWIRPGDLVIATGAVRDEGVSRHYVDLGHPAIADLRVTNALRAAATKQGIDGAQPSVHCGIVHTSDAFKSPVLTHALADATTARILAFEMETSALLILGGLRGVATGSILSIDGWVSNVFSGNSVPDHAARDRAVTAMIAVALDAAIALNREIPDASRS